MKPGARVAAFVALLVVLFAAAAIAGGAIDSGSDDGDGAHPSAAAGAQAGHGGVATSHHTGTQPASTGHGDSANGSATTVHGGSAMGSTPADGMPAGVASSHGGYRLVTAATRFAAGRAAPLRFRIVDAGGATVRDFETEQARKMHVIVVRRDLRRYQHLHPTRGSDGAWTTSLTLPDAGVYRAFADFTVAGTQHTLGIDLFVPGAFEPKDLPAPSTTATVDGYEVKLHEHAGQAGFFVRRNGKLVTDLEPYLGARGHLVALREGDLAYEHVHPDAGPRPEVAFHLAASEPGSYRLFLQFRHEGRVHTAAFTKVVR